MAQTQIGAETTIAKGDGFLVQKLNNGNVRLTLSYLDVFSGAALEDARREQITLTIPKNKVDYFMKVLAGEGRMYLKKNGTTEPFSPEELARALITEGKGIGSFKIRKNILKKFIGFGSSKGLRRTIERKMGPSGVYNNAEKALVALFRKLQRQILREKSRKIIEGKRFSIEVEITAEATVKIKLDNGEQKELGLESPEIEVKLNRFNAGDLRKMGAPQLERLIAQKVLHVVEKGLKRELGEYAQNPTVYQGRLRRMRGRLGKRIKLASEGLAGAIEEQKLAQL